MADLLKSLVHPSEVAALFKLKFGGKVRKLPSGPLDSLAKVVSDEEFAYATLAKVSRSFAVVIQQLPECLRDCVCIFYLVLRGLDSVEDDMTLPNARKVPLLLDFHNKLEEDGWHIENVGDGPDYRILLANFEKVIRMYKQLAPGYRMVIKDITARMGAGMAEFAEKTIQGFTSVADYNLYCHYVAGLVGHGLSGLFSASGLESPTLKNELTISNSMGLFLQKTNIIRDYLEDLDQGRTWWPQEIWSLYAKDLGEFKRSPKSDQSLACLNHMVNDALSHVPDCLKYLSMIKDIKIFQFCAIPQIMAIATLAEVYNNPHVFTRVVKVRKGLSCRLMLESSSVAQVANWFNTFANQVLAKLPSKTDPTVATTAKLLHEIKGLIAADPKFKPNDKIPHGPLRVASAVAWICFTVAMIYLISRYRVRHNELDTGSMTPVRLTAYDYSAFLGAFISLAYIFGFFGIHML